MTGTLSNFILEPFLPHPSNAEYYVCITSKREGDTILFTHEGGVDIGDVDAKALKLDILVNKPFPNRDKFAAALLKHVPPEKQDTLVDFLLRLYSVYVDLHFAYLEINPLVCLDGVNGGQPTIHYLDMAAKLDQTADSICGPKWAIARDLSVYDVTAATPTRTKGVSADRGPPMVSLHRHLARSSSLRGYDPRSGRRPSVVTSQRRKLISRSSMARLVLRLNSLFSIPRVGYGQWSQAVVLQSSTRMPSQPTVLHMSLRTTENTLVLLRRARPTNMRRQLVSVSFNVLSSLSYIITVDLITRGTPNPKGKILIIGGGIANFTNVAATFKGIIRALQEYKTPLISHQVRIYVRRGGPNYQEGLKAMRLLGESLGVPIKVYGPETHITEIVPLALGVKREATPPAPSTSITSPPSPDPSKGAPSSDSTAVGAIQPDGGRAQPEDQIVRFETSSNHSRPSYRPFDATTRSFVYGLQPRAIQGMLDFDYSCGRETPSVAAMIYPFGGHHIQKFYWGTKETLLPVYTSVAEAVKKHPDVDVVVNFASSRSVYSSTLEILTFAQIKAIAIIAEGVPERQAREILHTAIERNVHIIGPATVGGIKPGCFKIGNSGGMMDNIIASKLYRPGSVGYVSKSGGMSNELNNILSLYTNGTYEGIAIGGDRYPGSTFIDHLLRYEQDPECKLLVLLGEVGGIEEYRVIEAVKEGTIKKPIIAWAIGTCAKMFATEVQFGHAGSMANSDMETADAKNRAMREAGFIVPETFEDLPQVLKETYDGLVSKGTIKPTPEREPPVIPMDYKWAQELGLIRKPSAFISTISDERGQELIYAGMRISDVFKEDIGLGGVVSLLWFKRRLPLWATKFIEMVLMLTADHGPAVSG